MTPGTFDYSKLWPAPTETPFEYWLSLSPAAPFFGVPWRFADASADAVEAGLTVPVARKKAPKSNVKAPAAKAVTPAKTAAHKKAAVKTPAPAAAPKVADAKVKAAKPAAVKTEPAEAKVSAPKVTAKAAAPKSVDPKPVPAKKADVAKAETSKPAAKKTVAKTAEAPKAAAPAKPDDLTTIKGIGPKMAEALNAAGVSRFADIAGWSVQDVARMDGELGGLPGRITRDKWVDQAKALVG